MRLYLLTVGAAAAVFLLLPGIDLWVSRQFHTPGQGFELARAWPFLPVHDGVPYLIIASVMVALALYAANRLWRLRLLELNGRALVFVLASLALGPGLLANVLLKDQMGRARPAQIVEFGGTKQFTPPLVPSDQCDRNCSFVAGDASAGFFLLAFALLARRHRMIAIAAAVASGALLGLNRVVQGGHFLSDVIFAGLFVSGLIWLLHVLIVQPGGPRRVLAGLRGMLAEWRDFVRPRLGRVAGRLQLAAILLGIATLVSVALVDRPVAMWARGFDGDLHELFKLTSEIGRGTGWLIASALACLGLWLASRLTPSIEREQQLRSWSFVPLYLFSAMAAAGIANSVVKGLVGRFRPKLYFLDGRYGFELFRTHADYVSFPSGHTCLAFALATALTVVWPRHVAAYFLVALLVAASRILVQAHWVSDTLGGAFIGVAAALYVRHVFLVNGVAMGQALGGAAHWRWRPTVTQSLALDGLVARLRHWRDRAIACGAAGRFPPTKLGRNG